MKAKILMVFCAIIFWIQCKTTNKYLDPTNYINSIDCELNRFKGLYLYKTFDKNRICVYSPTSKYLKKFLNHPSTILYNIKTKEVITGLDIAEKLQFEFLNHFRFGILTNATGVNKNLHNIIHILIDLNKKPDLIIEPEHGIFGSEDTLSEKVLRIEKLYQIPILNLYSKIKKPPLNFLQNLDTIVIDIQNLPVRCYTYISTLTYILEAANELQIEVIILDRPHPYGIWKPKGHFLQDGYQSFIGEAPIPFLYSLTPGEYAIYMALYKFLNLKVKVLRMENFHPENVNWTLANTWINPSPNIPNLESALLYAGMVFFEGTNLSVGRGTTKPFHYIGSPWLKNDLVLKELQNIQLNGVKFGLIEFRPTYSIYKGELCKGLQFYPISSKLDPIKLGYELMRIIKKQHPHFYFKKINSEYLIDKLWGSDSYRKALELDLSYEDFKKLWLSETEFFEELINPILLYK